MKDITAIILAAGRGTRMKSDLPKALHSLLGKPVISHILESLKASGVSDIIIVAGYGAEDLKKVVGAAAKVVVQKKLLGSGDAVMTARKAIGDHPGDILIVCGDTPLVDPVTIKALVERHKSSGAHITLLTAKVENPTGYGRIARDANGRISKIVEELEADLYHEVIKEINAGTYCCKAKDMFDALAGIRPNDKKKEKFLTDVIGVLYKKGRRIESVAAKDPDEAIGINTRKDLAKVTAVLKNRILEWLMNEGVTIEDPDSTVVYPGVEIGRDTVIRSNTVIESDVRIGRYCHIGPFARLRPGTSIGDNVEIGNFVEINRTSVGDGARIKHHTYLGDAVVGKDVNVGAGTITANYDGRSKNRTVIEDGAFIGVGAILIAPVRIGKLATVGAGSVVPKNHNVPRGSVVIGVPARIFKDRRAKDRRTKG